MNQPSANPIDPGSVADWQREVGRWVRSRFGISSLIDPRERALRVLEEAYELAQAAEIDVAPAAAVMEHVYQKPCGELKQEAAGVVLTLFALAGAHGFDLLAETRQKIGRIPTVPIEVSRARQTSKAEASIGRRPSPGPDK